MTRESFKLRWERNDAVFLHEFFYAIMQGYDAFSLKADVQVGGTDQLFNIVTAARKVMAFLGAKPNIAIILGILPGTDGVVKMSKSLGNHIPINTDAEDLYGKVMSIPDFAMSSFFRLVTRWEPPQIETIEKALNDGSMHPRDAKMKLAYEVAASFYGEEDAQKAQGAFVSKFQKKETPDEMPEFKLEGAMNIVDVLIATHLAASRGEARRLIEQKGVRINNEVVNDSKWIAIQGVLQVGKRNFVRLS
jgi:tyrosyl-tRNA synthetase